MAVKGDRKARRIRRQKLVFFPRSRKQLVPLILLAVPALLAAGACHLGRPSSTEEGMTALVNAFRLQRPLDSRISGFDYAPRLETRGNADAGADKAAWNRAERLLLDAEAEHPGAAASHALGRMYLAKRDFETAIKQFEIAMKAGPATAALYCDLGVAMLEQTLAHPAWRESGAEVERLSMVLERFDQALALAPTMPEALFNRALLYEHLSLPQRAREGWQSYLALDAASPWAEEARRNLRRLESAEPPAPAPSTQLVEDLGNAMQARDDERAWRIISQNRDRIGSVAAGTVVEAFQEACDRGDAARAGQLLNALRYAGDVENRLAGDRFITDLAAYYKRSGAHPKASLAKGRAALKAGLGWLKALDLDRARESLLQAKQLFAQSGDLMESLQADFLLAGCYRKQAELPARAAIYDRMAQVCRKSQYKWLLMQVLLEQASLEGGLANYSNVIERSREAREIAKAIDDRSGWASSLLQGAEALFYMGNHHESLRLYYEGISMTNQRPASLWVRWALNMCTAFPLNALGRTTAAAAYQQESLRLARLINSPKQIGLSHVHLSWTYAFQRRFDEAMQQAQQARDHALSIPEGDVRRELLALASLRLGQLFAQRGDFIRAGEYFDQSLGLYDGLNSQEAFRYSAQKGKLIAALARGESAGMESQIATVVELYEKFRGKIREESSRNSFFDGEQSIYDIAIDFWYAQKRDERGAFELSERCQARSLLDAVSTGPIEIEEAGAPDLAYKEVAASLSLAEIEARLPPKAQIVQYAVLKDRLLLYVLSPGRRLVVREQKISAQELHRQIASYLEQLRRRPQPGESFQPEPAQRLYQSLIDPVADLLDRQKQLCIVPDKALNQLPFAALLAPETGRFLIEDFALVFAPSATMFILGSEIAAAKAGVRAEQLLSVGNPAFDRDLFSQEYLDPAEQEARSIADLYIRPRRLLGPEATRDRFVRDLDQVDVLHMAVHGLVDERSPMRSKLLLAKSGPGPSASEAQAGALFVHEIYRLPLARLRLVVLAACRSGVERYYGGEGMIGISRPFLAKKVPLVVAGLWDAFSPATRELMIGLHQGRKTNRLATADALRQSQLKMLHDPSALYRHPHYWAAFECIGGYAEF